MTDDPGKSLVIGAGIVSTLGVIQSGGAGISALAQLVEVPLWFVIVAWILPTGETLRVVRTIIRSYLPGESK